MIRQCDPISVAKCTRLLENTGHRRSSSTVALQVRGRRRSAIGFMSAQIRRGAVRPGVARSRRAYTASDRWHRDDVQCDGASLTRSPT